MKKKKEIKVSDVLNREIEKKEIVLCDICGKRPFKYLAHIYISLNGKPINTVKARFICEKCENKL
jgi:hypothetical protein